MNPRPVLLLVTDVDDSLPAAGEASRGVIALTRAASTEDVVSIGLLDGSDVNQWRQLLTKVLGDTLYSATGHSHANPGITVSEGGTPRDTDITTLDFDPNSFNVTESPENEANIALALGTSGLQAAAGNHNHDADYSDIAHDHDADYADISHTHTQIFNPVPARFPVGNIQDTAAAATSFVSNSSYAAYMGRADAAYTTVNLRVQVDTGAATITWAEVGVGTSAAITLNGAASITRRGFTNVAASFNTTGDKTVAVTTTGIAVGDHLWALFGSQATTPYQLRAVAAESTDAGTDQSVAATRISTMSSPTAFAVSAIRLGAGFWIGSV